MLANIVSVLVAIGLAFVVMKLVQYRAWLRQFSPDIPHPKGVFLLQNLPLLSEAYKQGDFAKLYSELSKKHGKVVALWAFGAPIFVIVSSLPLIKQIGYGQRGYRGNHTTTRTNQMMPSYQRVFGKAIANTSGHEWKFRRDLVQQLFIPRELFPIAFPAVTRYAHQLLLNIDTSAKTHSKVEIARPYELLTCNVITQLIFGPDFDWQATPMKKTEEVIEAITCMSNDMLKGCNPLSFWFLIRDHVEPKARMRNAIYPIIQKFRAGEGESCLMQRLANDAKGLLTEDELFSEALVLFFGGTDTTARTLAFATYLLATNPEALQKVHEEAVRVLGPPQRSGDGSLIEIELTPSHFADLRYTACVFKETMRLYPITPILSFDTVAPLELDGYKIPAGVSINCCLPAVYHDPSIFEDPDAFKPERWLNDDADDLSFGEQKSALPFLSFSLGSHQCVGKILSRVEGVLTIALLARAFTMKVEQGYEPEVECIGILRPKNGVYVSFHQRDE